MAKVIITIEDDPAPDGEISVKAEFEPEMTRDAPLTPAQQTAVILLQVIIDGQEGPECQLKSS